MRQRKRRLCTVLLCAILTISNILSAGMPVYARTADTGTGSTNAVYTNETAPKQEEVQANETPGTSEEQVKEEQENQDSTATGPDTETVGGPEAGDNTESSEDTESGDDSPAGDDGDIENDNGSDSDPGAGEDPNTDQDSDNGEDSDVDAPDTDIDADVDEDTDAEETDTDEDVELPVNIAGGTQLYASGDYLTEDPQHYNLTDVTMTPGSYSAKFSATFSNVINSNDQMIVIYTTDNEAADDFFSGASSIEKSKLDDSTDFKAVHLENLDSQYRSGYDDNNNYTYYYDYTGTFVGNGVLTPDTTYYYRLAFYEGTYYSFLTVPDQFTTGSAVAETRVSIRDIEAEISYTRVNVVWTVNNPDREDLFDMQLYYTADGEEYDTLSPSPYTDTSGHIVPNKYYATLPELTDARKAYVGLSVYTGEEATQHTIQSEEINVTRKNFNDATINLTEKTGSGSFAASIELSPYYSMDGYIRASLYYRVKDTEDWSESTYNYAIISKNDDASASGTLTVSGLSDGTDYEYYITLEGQTVDKLGTAEKPLTFTTKEIVSYTDEDFPDDVFRSYVKRQIKIYDSDPITSDKLETLTSLSYSRAEANAAKAGDIKSLEGIGLIENLTRISFEGHSITELGDISNLSNLESINLNYNDFTELPNLSGLSKLYSVMFDYNKLDPDTVTADKLPAAFRADHPNWVDNTIQNQRGEVTWKLAPEYYAHGEARPFLIQVANLKRDYNRYYTLTLTIDGRSVSSDKINAPSNSNGIYYIKDILKDSSGTSTGITVTEDAPYTAEITLTDSYGNTYIDLSESITFTAESNGISTETRYIKPDARDVYLSIYNLPSTLTQEDVRSLELKNADGETVGSADPSKASISTGSYNNYNNPYKDVFDNFYSSGLSDMSVTDLSATFYFAKYLSAGDYSAVITMADDSVLSLNDAVHVDTNAVLHSLYADSRYDNYGDYLYLYANGVNIDPSKVWPVLYEGDERITELVSSTPGYDRSTAVYKLRKLKKDTYWNTSPDVVYYCHYRFETAEGYEILDKITDKTLTLYAPDYYSSFVLFEHYNYKKGVYEVKTNSSVTDGTQVSVSVYTDYAHYNLKGTAEGVVEDSTLLLEFKNEYGETYAPPRYQTSYFVYSYTDADGKEHTFNHEKTVTWYNYDETSSGNTGSSVTSNMFLYQERMMKELAIDISFPATMLNSGQKVTAQIYTSGSSVGESVSMTGKTASNGYVRIAGTWKDDTGLDTGTYTIQYRRDDTNGIIYTQTLYVYDNDKFYMDSQHMNRWTSSSTDGFYVYFSSLQLYGNYVNQYNSKVSDTAALNYWNDGGYKLEIFDRLGREISGWSIDHASWSGRYFYLYLKDLSEDYTGYYIKITKNGASGIVFNTGNVYYAATYDANEQYGEWSTIYSGFSYYSGEYAYVGFSADTDAYPVKVTITRPYDTDVITSFTASSPNRGNVYYFTANDLSETQTNEVYTLTLEGNNGIISSVSCYLATEGQSTVVNASGISLNKTKLNMQLGQSEKLTATVKPDNASNKTVAWSSNDSSVATVDAQGVVTAKGVGTATITASTNNEKTATCTVEVFNYTLSQTTLSFDLSSGTVPTETLTVSDGNKDITSSVTWSSNDESVVTVSKGVVTPAGTGTAKILATIKNGPTLTCDVTVNRDDLQEVRLSDSTCALNAGDTKQLKLFLTPSDTTAVSEIKWESDNGAVASVAAIPQNDDSTKSLTALVTAIAKGETKITVTVTAKSGATMTADCKVTVNAVTTAVEAEEAKANIPELTALTNVQLTLTDVKLPEGSGWTWLNSNVSLKQFAGIQKKYFAAQYCKEEGAAPYTIDLPVTLSTVTGISIGADSSSIQKGKTMGLSVVWSVNGTLLDMSEYADQVSWSIDKSNVASLSSATGLTPTLTGVAAGNVTVKAEVKFKEGTYKAQYKVTVTDSDIADIQVISANPFTADTGNPSIYNGKVTSTAGEILVTVNNAVTSNTTKLTVKSNNTKVITVGKVTSEGQNYTIPFTVKAAGTAQITLTANDAAKTKKDIWLYVTDPKPNISEDTVTVNLQQTTGTVFYLYPNAGYEVANAVLAGDTAGKFTLEPGATSDNYVIKANTNTAKGSYKLSLTGKVKPQQGDAQEEDYSVTFTVKVVDQAPKYKVKQITKVNLFYKDAASILDITSDEILVEANLTGCDFTLENRYGTYRLVPVSSKTGSAINSYSKKGKLTLTFAGYKEVETNFTVSLENKAPKITLGSSSVTMYPSVGLNRAVLNILGYWGASVNLDEATKAAGFNLNVNDDNLILTGTNLTKNATFKAKLEFNNSSWAGKVLVPYTIKVNMGKPAAKLQKSTLQLNTNTASMAYDAASTEVMWKDGAEFNPLGVSVSAADAKSQAIINSGVVFGFDRAENKVIAKLNNTAVAKGSYKFKVNVRVTDTVTVTTPLTVKIVDVTMDKAIKVSSKGSIDVLNRWGTYVTVTPKLNSLNGTIDDVSLSGEAAHLFDAVCGGDNTVIIYAKSDAALITKYDYRVKLDLTIKNAEGDTIRYTTPDVKLKLKQGKPKVSIAPKTTTFFSGAYNSMTENISATLKGAENPVIENVELINNQDAFTCSYKNETIILTNTQGAIKGKTYSLQFKVTFAGQADNEKATTVKYSVKVK